jgi:acid phosphatase
MGGVFRAVTAVLATALIAVTACGAPAGPTADPDSTGPVIPSTGAGLPRPAHVLVVIFENKSASEVIDSSAAPYLTSLAARGAEYVRAHGIAHPSQPNYLALFSGSTHGITSDSCAVTLPHRPNLAGQLRAAGRSFVGYAESLPAPGYSGCKAGDYARKHAPWVDFPDLPAGLGQPFSRFPSAFGSLPTVAFVVPNLCNDMHDCPVHTGDRWARLHLAPYVAWARGHDSLLIVTFDEDDGTKSNLIPTLLVGPMVRPGAYRQLIDHYNVLRTIEDMYGLAALGLARRARPVSCWLRGSS